MQREFLRNLGIEEKETIDRILDENSADIGRAKGDLATYKSKVTSLEDELTAAKAENTKLADKLKDFDALQSRVSQLETDKSNLTTELNTKLSQIQKTHAIENEVRNSKAKNLKAVIAQLDMNKITFDNGELQGLSEQLEALKNNDETSFLFGEAQSNSPVGTHANTPNASGSNAPIAKSLSDAIAKKLNK